MTCPLSIRSVEVCSQAIIKRIIRLLLFLGKRPHMGSRFRCYSFGQSDCGFRLLRPQDYGYHYGRAGSPEFGLGAYKDNVGSMVNRGMELTVSYNDKWGDWSFGATANLAYNKNKILDLDGVSSLVDGDLKIRQVGEALQYVSSV